MKIFYKILIIFLILSACSKEEEKIALIKENRQDLEMILAYKEGYIALEQNDPYFAAQKFLDAELLFPQSDWAPKAALMASYAYYLQNFYSEAIDNLNRYLVTYPNSRNIDYAHYLIAICYYETIEDEKRDLAPLNNAKKKFDYIVKTYPETEFAKDAKFKLDFINDILASKEMYIGRHYVKREKWIAAINRFKNVVEYYDETIFVEEALHRLVEINFKLGLENEAKKYANLLGYNYSSGDWYKKSYKIFNTNYTIIDKKRINKDKQGVVQKFKKLFE